MVILMNPEERLKKYDEWIATLSRLEAILEKKK